MFVNINKPEGAEALPRLRAINPSMIRNWPQATAHIDADYFFANCELMRRPELRGKPVMVLGKLDSCILAKTPEAKKLGISTALPVWEAKKKCPQGIFIHGDFRYYTLMSRKMMSIFRDWSPVTEVYSIDEAFLDLKGLRGMYHKSYEQIAESICREVEVKLGITVSIGVSVNKTLAKMACELNKPNGVTVVPGADIEDFSSKIPVADIPGIGRSRQELLQKYRVNTCSDLTALSPTMVQRMFGKMGLLLWRELRGEYSFPVTSDPPPPKQIARTSSFEKPTTDLRMVEGLAFYHLERALEALHRHKLMTSEVLLYLRDKAFRTYFPYLPLHAPTDDFFTIAKHVAKIIKMIPQGGIWRSTGIVLAKLQTSKCKQLNIFDGVEKVVKAEKVNEAKNKLNEFYGREAVSSASTLFLKRKKQDELSRLGMPLI